VSEFFIVLSHPATEHETLPEAMASQRALQAHVPERTHTIYRCKRWLTGAKHFTKMVDLLNDIVRDGLTPANLDRARVLQVTIGNRTPRLKALHRVPGPPEYQPPAAARTGA
jgi:hypothetical protein